MRTKLTSLFSLTFTALIVFLFVFSAEKDEVQILIFSKTAGYRHESIEAGIEAIKKLGEQHNFQVEATEDASLFNEDKLKKFNVVVFLNTTMDVLDKEQQSQFERFIQAGGGFVGVHAAADTEYEWPWYGKLVGAYFNGHPGNPNVREATLHIVDSEHSPPRCCPKTGSDLTNGTTTRISMKIMMC